VKYKDATPQPLRDFIYERNIKEYGDPLRPTFEWLIEEGRTFEQIVNSAPKFNPSIDGVLAPFEEWLRSQ